MQMSMEPLPRRRTTAWSDLHMLVAVGGRERTEAEFVDLLASAALEVTRILPIGLEF